MNREKVARELLAKRNNLAALRNRTRFEKLIKWNSEY